MTLAVTGIEIRVKRVAKRANTRCIRTMIWCKPTDAHGIAAIAAQAAVLSGSVYQ